MLQSKTPAVYSAYDDGERVTADEIYMSVYCGLVVALLLSAAAIFLLRKYSKSFLTKISEDDPNFEACKDYQVNFSEKQKFFIRQTISLQDS